MDLLTDNKPIYAYVLIGTEGFEMELKEKGLMIDNNHIAIIPHKPKGLLDKILVKIFAKIIHKFTI